MLINMNRCTTCSMGGVLRIDSSRRQLADADHAPPLGVSASVGKPEA